MKKITSIILLLIIISSCLAVSGCELFGNGGSETTSSTTRTFMPTTTTKKYLEEPESFGDEVSLKTKFEIINLFLLWSGIQTDKKPEEINCEFFGQFGDSVAVYFQTAGAYFVKGYDFVSDFYFHYPDSRRIKIFNNGKLYSLSDAYQNGMITRDNVCAIYYKFSYMVIEDPYLVYCEPRLRYDRVYPLSMGTESILVTIDPALYTPGKYLTEEFFADIPNIERIELDYEGRVFIHQTAKGAETLIYRLYLETRSTEKLIQAFYDAIKVNGICFAEPDHSWGFGSAGGESTYAIYPIAGEVLGSSLFNISLPDVWNFTSGSSAVRVGVLDSGIAPHEDLDDNYELGLDFLNQNLNDPIQQKIDINNHGTHVAGIIGAVGDNEKGIYGINKEVSLVQLRISSLGGIDPIITKNAINWATQSFSTDDPIRVLNASFKVDPHESLENAIINYTNAGGLFVCAAGNGYGDLEVQTVYPAGYSNEIDNMIVVGALNSTFDDLWVATDDGFYVNQGSNWGAQTVDIYAPGANILSTFPSDLCGESDNSCLYPGHYSYGYHYMSGTSMATPMVTGVAALLFSVSPDLTAAQVKECILEGADEIIITTKDGETQNVKKLNAWGAFKYLMDNYYQMPSATIESLPITVTGTIVSNGDYFVNNTYMQKFIASESGYYDFTVSSGYAIDVTLYDADFNEIPVIYTTTQNGNTVQFAYGLEEEKTYYVRSSFNNSVTVPTSIVINVSDHTHEYSNAMYIDINVHTESCIYCGHDIEDSHNLPENWTYKDQKDHKKHCSECDSDILEAHIIRVSEIIGGRAPCIYCKWMINVGDFSGVIHQIPKVSLNGSYILPNGVIVLVDEDVEAYINGTLVFYDRDKLPETE